MMIFKASERLTMDEVLSHRWLEDDVPSQEDIALEFHQRNQILMEKKE